MQAAQPRRGVAPWAQTAFWSTLILAMPLGNVARELERQAAARADLRANGTAVVSTDQAPLGSPPGGFCEIVGSRRELSATIAASASASESLTMMAWSVPSGDNGRTARVCERCGRAIHRTSNDSIVLWDSRNGRAAERVVFSGCWACLIETLDRAERR